MSKYLFTSLENNRIFLFFNFYWSLTRIRGASSETIDALPKYKFKTKKSSEGNGSKDDSESSGEDGIIAVGTDKERSVSTEDAVCVCAILCNGNIF